MVDKLLIEETREGFELISPFSTGQDIDERIFGRKLQMGICTSAAALRMKLMHEVGEKFQIGKESSEVILTEYSMETKTVEQECIKILYSPGACAVDQMVLTRCANTHWLKTADLQKYRPHNYKIFNISTGTVAFKLQVGGKAVREPRTFRQ